MNGPIRSLILRAAWAPIGVVALHGLLTAVFGHQRSLDPGFHFLGGVAGAFFAAEAISAFLGFFGRPTIFARNLIAVAFTCTVALAWEFAELASDLFRGTHIQTSVEETLADLALGCGGALLFVGVSALFLRPVAPREKIAAGAAPPRNDGMDGAP